MVDLGDPMWKTGKFLTDTMEPLYTIGGENGEVDFILIPQYVMWKHRWNEVDKPTYPVHQMNNVTNPFGVADITGTLTYNSGTVSFTSKRSGDWNDPGVWE